MANPGMAEHNLITSGQQGPAMCTLAPQHADMFSTLMELYQDPAFMDFTVRLKDGAMPASRILIATLSPFFRKLVTADMVEGRSGEVQMDHITVETWNCIVTFYFTRERLVTIRNVDDVLVASHMYGLDRLESYCCEILLAQCDIHNCLAIKRIAEHYDLPKIKRRANRVLGDNFSEVCKTEEFLCLVEREVLELLEKEELVTTEDGLCEALLLWSKAQTSSTDALAAVFRHIRLNRVTLNYLFDLIFNYRNSPLGTVMFPALKEEYMRRQHTYAKVMADTTPRRRRSPSANTTLLVLGHNLEGNFRMYLWSALEQRWINQEGPYWKVPEHFASAAVDDFVIVTGGGTSTGNGLYNRGTERWTRGQDMPLKKRDHGMVTIRNSVYVVGGFSCRRLTSIEEYRIQSDQWMHAGNLLVATDECGVAALGDIILVVGGSTLQVGDLVQTFNVKTLTAAVLGYRLPRPMHHVRAASFDGTAFFVSMNGDLLQIHEVAGQLEMVCQGTLESFSGEKAWFCLRVREDRLWVVGGSSSRAIDCWDYQGHKTPNNWVASLPEDMCVYSLLEV